LPRDVVLSGADNLRTERKKQTYEIIVRLKHVSYEQRCRHALCRHVCGRPPV